jgi:hypothetical protein
LEQLLLLLLGEEGEGVWVKTMKRCRRRSFFDCFYLLATLRSFSFFLHVNFGPQKWRCRIIFNGWVEVSLKFWQNILI